MPSFSPLMFLTLALTLVIASPLKSEAANKTKSTSSHQSKSSVSKNRQPSQDSVAEIEAHRYVRENGCIGGDVMVSPIALKAGSSEESDLLVACSDACSVHGCTSFIFASVGEKRYRLAGLVDGICRPTGESDHQYKRIACISRSGGETLSNTWRYDGNQYR